MRNVIDKTCRENKHTFYIHTHFSKIVPFMRLSKNVVEPQGLQTTSQYGAYVLDVGYLRLHAHKHTPGHPSSHARTQNTYCFFPRQQWFVLITHPHLTPSSRMSEWSLLGGIVWDGVYLCLCNSKVLVRINKKLSPPSFDQHFLFFLYTHSG
jgi:hypothetical protein